MCGLTAIFGEDVGEQDLEEMLKVASRRGPDTANTRRVDDGVLGHTLLAFVNEGNNPQPYVDGDSVIVYNGEVYNWRELNQKHGFNANTDTATLLRGIKQKGMDFLREIDGQFAFVAQMPSLNGKLETVVGRDKWGISPMVYGLDNLGRVVIGSTTETVVAGGVDPLDVKTVPAGTHGIVNGKGIELKSWFKLPYVKPENQKKADIENLKRKSVVSVECRIPDAKNKLYTAMGGIDSQFITVTVARKTRGNFGGAITVVPWDENDPDNKKLGDYEGASTTVEMLAKEGIDINHFIVQMTPEYVNSAIDRVMNVLGPDYFNVCCGLAEDLVATIAKKIGGKAIMTAGGPDEAGRSYKPMNLRHKGRLEEGWYGLCDQFASSEGVRAGLIFGEHGLENRVPLAFLIEESQYMKPEEKLKVHDWGDGKNPMTIKQDEKVFWKKVVEPYLPKKCITIPKNTVHGATGTRPTLNYISDRDANWQKEKAGFYDELKRKGWVDYMIPSGDKSPFGDGPAYCLWRWKKFHQREFEAGPKSRYLGKTGNYFYNGANIEDKISRPLCVDHMSAEPKYKGERKR